ncbi:MAG: lasso peptide biosynthesis B2 protein [Rhizomicrobium sp.]
MAETLLALALAWVLVFAVPFRRTAAWLGQAGAPGSAAAAIAPDQLLRARSVCRRAARLAPRVPWRTSCLVQAVAGCLLLRRRGIAATIRLGVKKGDGALSAHAWLMVGGQTVLGGDAAEGFTPLADIGDVT